MYDKRYQEYPLQVCWRPTGRVLITLKERKFPDSIHVNIHQGLIYREFRWYLHTCSFSALLCHIGFLLTLTSIDFKNYVCKVVPFGVMSHQDFYLFVVRNTLLPLCDDISTRHEWATKLSDFNDSFYSHSPLSHAVHILTPSRRDAKQKGRVTHSI